MTSPLFILPLTPFSRSSQVQRLQCTHRRKLTVYRWRMNAETLKPVLRVCRVCKQQFDPAENNAMACHHHTTVFSGRLLRVEPTETSDIGFFYDCCGATDVNAPGCHRDFHRTYDED